MKRLCLSVQQKYTRDVAARVDQEIPQLERKVKRVRKKLAVLLGHGVF